MDRPIDPEPRIRALFHLPECTRPVDDGRVPSLIGRLLANRRVPEPAGIASGESDRHDHGTLTRPLVSIETFRLVVPSEMKTSFEQTEQIFSNLANATSFISFEVLGNSDSITFQIAVPSTERDTITALLKNHLPGINFQPGDDAVKKLVQPGLSGRLNAILLADFGLGREWFKPLPVGRSFATDPFLPLIASLDEITEGETICFQVLLQRTRQNWNMAAQNTIFDEDGKLRFVELQNVLPGIKDKLSRSLFAVNVRFLVQSGSNRRSQQIARRLSTFFRQFSSAHGNELIPLRNDGFAADKHLQSFVDRTTYRFGALLSAPEISGLVHFPTDAIQSIKLRRNENKTKPVPPIAVGREFVLGENRHMGETKTVSISADQRTRHMVITGGTGVGKSNFLLHQIKQDLEHNHGLCVIDPHGDLVDAVIDNIPESRLDDVILFDPADSEHPIPFNILHAESELEKTLLASDLVATFRRFSTSWGDVMDSVLANAILAFVESSRGGTLFELKRFLVEKDFRNEFLQTVTDDAVIYFWQNEFPLLHGKPQSSILIRLDSFLRQRLIRNIVCQKNQTLNFREIMDNNKILLIKLSQGLIGEENSYLLGTLLISKLQQTALSRQDIAADKRKFFPIFADEYHHLVVPSTSTLISGIRKFGVGLTLASQSHRQVAEHDAAVASSVLTNCGTRICFRLGDADADKFANGFSFFDARALQNLGVGEAIARIERAEFDFNLRTPLVPKVESELGKKRSAEVVRLTRERYSNPRSEVEAEITVSRPTVPHVSTVGNPKNEEGYPPARSISKTHDAPLDPITQTVQDENTVPAKLTSQDFPFGNRRTGQHQYLQSLVKRMAESKGFRVSIEKPVFGGAGKIDVVLETESRKIACEISVTNEPRYEVQNAQKCIAAGYDPVALISADERHLEKIRVLVTEAFSTEDLSKIVFLTPEGFFTWLDELDAGTDSESQKKVKGFRVKVSLKPIDANERAVRKKAISDVVLGGLKKAKDKTSDK